MTATTAVTESAWQDTVVALLHSMGWRHNFTRRARSNHGWATATTTVGWPDLTAWSEAQRRLIFVELKREKAKPTPAQEAVIASLRAAGQEVYVWRPSDWDEAVAIVRGTDQ